MKETTVKKIIEFSRKMRTFLTLVLRNSTVITAIWEMTAIILWMK